MYRQIFIPDKQNNHIPFTIPHEWYGLPVEIIVFPVIEPNNLQSPPNDDDFYRLSGVWESDQSAEEMAKELKAARKFRKKDLSF
jgi:hypothetical protein